MVISAPVRVGVRATPDPNVGPTVHGTWGDPCYEQGSGFYSGLCLGRGQTSFVPNLGAAQSRPLAVQAEQWLRPAVGATATLIQGCSGALDSGALRSAKRIRLFAQIESEILVFQAARRRSILGISEADLELRSRGEAVAALRRGQFAESARLARVRRHGEPAAVASGCIAGIPDSARRRPAAGAR